MSDEQQPRVLQMSAWPAQSAYWHECYGCGEDIQTSELFVQMGLASRWSDWHVLCFAGLPEQLDALRTQATEKLKAMAAEETVSEPPS